MATDSPDGRTEQTPTIVPFLRYDDAPSAIEWLVEAFGFERQLVVPAPDGSIAHAQLRFGSGIVMLGSTQEDGPLPLDRPPHVTGTSQGIYVHVEAIDAHYDRARAQGADIVIEIADQDYGSREYTARDPEGYLWSFGTYAPAG